LPLSNQIDSRAIPHIARLTGLEALFLGGAAIQDEDVKNLAGLTNLKALHLQDCPLTDNAVDRLAALKSLKRLNLWGTAITRKGYDRLKKQLPQCDIQWQEDLRKDHRLIGTWESTEFRGLSARAFASEKFVFNADGTFEEATEFAEGVDSSLSGTYRIEADKIVFDDGDGYTPEVPYEFQDGHLRISRRADIGRVTVILQKI
jgi:hypothetical protein